LKVAVGNPQNKICCGGINVKTKILDTNIILDYPITAIIESFSNGAEIVRVVIPFKVIMELDTFKNGNEPKNQNCRTAIRFLEGLRTQGSLIEGVEYGKNFIIQVHVDMEKLVLDPEKVDNNIVLTAGEIIKAGSQAQIVTRDLHERVLADVFGILAEDVNIDKATSDELYTGIEKIDIDNDQLIEWCSNPKALGSIESPKEFYPNEFIELVDPLGTSHYGTYNYKNNRIESLKRTYTAWGIKPKKGADGKPVVEQSMLMHLLLNPEVEFVSAIGPSGTGKTLLTLACALEQAYGSYDPLYERIVVLRPMVGVDKDIGAVPGTKEEKLEPWMGAIFDNLEFLLDNYTPKDLGAGSRKDFEYQPFIPREKIQQLMEIGKLELEAITFIRGRSMPKQFIIVDDAQNLTVQQATTIITRAGEGSKVVFLGDISRQQIDDKRLTPMSNGLAYVVDKLKGTDPIIGHITMKEVVRSRLASLGVQYL
jgi:PhoH-like ATPase